MSHEDALSKNPIESPEPNQEQISDYFRRLGLALRECFRILKHKEFGAFGQYDKDENAKKKNAKREGWFLGYHAIVEAAFALKVAELANLPEEEKSLLIRAAMLSDVQKRRTYETKRHKSTKAMLESRLEGEKKLKGIAPDLDPRVLLISRGTGTDYTEKFIEGRLGTGTPEQQLVERLEGYNSFIHSVVETNIDPTTGTQRTDIVSAEERIRTATERHVGGVAAEMRIYKGKEFPLFAIEHISNTTVEAELKNRINTHQPGTIEENSELWTLVRREIMRDIQNKKEIKLPASKI